MIATTTNFARRHLTASQKAAIAAELLPQYEEEAKKRLKTSSGGSEPRPREKVPQAETGKASEQAAKAVGVNPRYVSDAKKLKEESPKEFAAVKSGEKNHSESQLSIFAAEWQKTKGPKKRGPKKKDDSNCGNGATNTKARDDAADKFGIGGRTVSKAANVLDKGCDQLQQAAAVAAVRKGAKDRKKRKAAGDSVPQISGEQNKHSRETDTARAKLAGTNRQEAHVDNLEPAPQNAGVKATGPVSPSCTEKVMSKSLRKQSATVRRGPDTVRSGGSSQLPDNASHGGAFLAHSAQKEPTMVALATPVLGGTVRSSLAGTMLNSANEAYLAGHKIEAAAKLKEALRRHLAAQCELYRLESGGTPNELLERLKEAGSKISSYTEDVIAECDDVLALRVTGSGLSFCLDFVFELVGDDCNRVGGAL